MPNLAKLLKDEIQRLARKEVRESLGKLQKESTQLQRAVEQQKRQLEQLAQALQKGAKGTTRAPAAAAAPAEEAGDHVRITARWVVALRKRLGVSQSGLAELLGLNTQTVYQWEHKPGQLQFRGDTRDRILALRGVSRPEAQQRLAQLQHAARDASGRARSVRGRRPGRPRKKVAKRGPGRPRKVA